MSKSVGQRNARILQRLTGWSYTRCLSALRDAADAAQLRAKIVAAFGEEMAARWDTERRGQNAEAG